MTQAWEIVKEAAYGGAAYHVGPSSISVEDYEDQVEQAVDEVGSLFEQLEAAQAALSELSGYVRAHLAGHDADPELTWALALADAALGEGSAPPSASGQTEFVWLLERGQPEGLDWPEWYAQAPAFPEDYEGDWTRDPLKACRWETEAQAFAAIPEIEHRTGLACRPVEHGFAESSPAKRSEA